MQMFSLQVRDFVKGAVIAVISAVVTFLYSMAVMPDFSLDAIPYKGIASVALISFLSYIVKNYLTDETKDTVVGIQLPS